MWKPKNQSFVYGIDFVAEKRGEKYNGQAENAATFFRKCRKNNNFCTAYSNDFKRFSKGIGNIRHSNHKERHP